MRRLLSDDQLAIQEAARAFSREKLLPRYQAREKTGTVIDRALMRQMGGLGFIGADLGERYGGTSLTTLQSWVRFWCVPPVSTFAPALISMSLLLRAPALKRCAGLARPDTACCAAWSNSRCR